MSTIATTFVLTLAILAAIALLGGIVMGVRKGGRK